MKFVKLETQEQFNQLKEGDLVIVDFEYDHKPTTYNIYGVIAQGKELLLHKGDNKYFNIEMYLTGKSYCKEAWLVTK